VSKENWPQSLRASHQTPYDLSVVWQEAVPLRAGRKPAIIVKEAYLHRECQSVYRDTASPMIACACTAVAPILS